MKKVVIEIKGEVPDDVSISEIENKVYDADILDFIDTVEVSEE